MLKILIFSGDVDLCFAYQLMDFKFKIRNLIPAWCLKPTSHHNQMLGEFVWTVASSIPGRSPYTNVHTIGPNVLLYSNIDRDLVSYIQLKPSTTSNINLTIHHPYNNNRTEIPLIYKHEIHFRNVHSIHFYYSIKSLLSSADDRPNDLTISSMFILYVISRSSFTEKSSSIRESLTVILNVIAFPFNWSNELRYFPTSDIAVFDIPRAAIKSHPLLSSNAPASKQTLASKDLLVLIVCKNCSIAKYTSVFVFWYDPKIFVTLFSFENQRVFPKFSKRISFFRPANVLVTFSHSRTRLYDAAQKLCVDCSSPKRFRAEVLHETVSHTLKFNVPFSSERIFDAPSKEHATIKATGIPSSSRIDTFIGPVFCRLKIASVGNSLPTNTQYPVDDAFYYILIVSYIADMSLVESGVDAETKQLIMGLSSELKMVDYNWRFLLKLNKINICRRQLELEMVNYVRSTWRDIRTLVQWAKIFTSIFSPGSSDSWSLLKIHRLWKIFGEGVRFVKPLADKASTKRQIGNIQTERWTFEKSSEQIKGHSQTFFYAENNPSKIFSVRKNPTLAKSFFRMHVENLVDDIIIIPTIEAAVLETIAKDHCAGEQE
ncbi:hypothetical protein Bhyg_03938 [Pseudolycoriella hygida]|uniref:Uncharacterized protein n=1 Tax=Pseudolycoriella hygida TaxID=35572 RepID=A0A9Q0NEA2_9DIPT|nr:hypothetical protein Bhyg_03938 [Pseudolycoriella hygida]